jgi:hypothetical protein
MPCGKRQILVLENGFVQDIFFYLFTQATKNLSFSRNLTWTHKMLRPRCNFFFKNVLIFAPMRQIEFRSTNEKLINYFYSIKDSFAG